MIPARWPAVLALTAAGLVAQGFLQRPLARANEVRGARRLHAAPSSLGFRLATGGVTEAAADALWLTVLPRLGKPWDDPARKAAWIKSTALVMTDAHPRALYPLVYCAGYIEILQRRHPAFERVLRHGMEIETRGAFGRRARPNADDWRLPMELGMNLFMYGGPAERERALRWLRVSAEKPDGPDIVLDVLAAAGRKEGDDLAAWRLWLARLAGTTNRARQERFLRGAAQARLDALRKWALAAEGKSGRWPRSTDEVLAAAPAATAEILRREPERRAALLDGIRLLPSTRDLAIPSLTEFKVGEARAELLELSRAFEAERGRRPRNLRELEDSYGSRYPRPPLHGTRWELDAATGDPVLVFDLADPRLPRPAEVLRLR